MAKTEYGKAKKKLDEVFSQFIRLRDSDENGESTCVTCGKTDFWKYMQCGHFQVRTHTATRFHEKNCNCQCGGCNMADGEQRKHGKYIDKKYGKGTADKLEALAHKELKLSTQDLLDMIELYSKKVVELKKQKQL